MSLADGGPVWIARGLKWLAASLALLFVASVLWVAVYRFVDPPSTLLIESARWSGLAVVHKPVRIDAIAPALRESVIASEDQSFCSHPGFDTEAIDKAIEHNRHSRRVRGASTISQQTAKNVFLWPGRNFLRKGLEAYFTLLEELLWPKRRIIEVYLNVAEFGRGVFGAEAAAQRFFGKPARTLTAHEAALLAAVLPNPHLMHADRPSAYVEGRAETIEREARAIRRDGLTGCAL